MRNKLFSSINIVGLAISMSVGLLLIAFVLDLISYDKFHKNGERIYRITNVASFNGEQGGKYGTTSIKTGKLIREKVTGIEEVAIMRSDFSQDAQVGDNILPIKGFWAEPSLFNISYISDGGRQSPHGAERSLLDRSHGDGSEKTIRQRICVGQGDQIRYTRLSGDRCNEGRPLLFAHQLRSTGIVLHS